MKRILIPALLAFPATLCLADILHFNDGRPPQEGEIMIDTPAVVELRWEEVPGSGIFKTKQFAKKDIKRIEIETNEDKQFKTLQNLVPAGDRLTAKDYQDLIAKCDAFLNVFPDGRHFAKIEIIRTKLKEEHAKAAAGGLKLKGIWIKPADRARDAYGIDAGIELADMQLRFAAGDQTSTLRHFEKIEADFSGAKEAKQARELAAKTLKAYLPVVEHRLKQVPFEKQKRERNRLTLRVNQRKQALQAQEKADADYLKLVDHESKVLKTKWVSLNPYHGDQMRRVITSIKSTLKALEKETEDPEDFADALYRQAHDAAHGGTDESEAEAKELFGELKKLKVPLRYLTPLEEQLAAEKEPEPTPEPPKPAPPSTEEVPKPETEPGKTAKESNRKKDKTGSVKSVDPADSSYTKPDTSGGSKMQMILVVVLVVVIVGALIAAFAGKKKKK